MVSKKTEINILVVDDDAVNREILEAYLVAENYRVLHASNGVQALEIVRKAKPDLLILDVSMPGISGYEVCSRVKSDPETCAIPVLIVTGFDSPSDRQISAEAGADGFLSRPFDGKRLLNTVKDLLR